MTFYFCKRHKTSGAGAPWFENLFFFFLFFSFSFMGDTAGGKLLSLYTVVHQSMEKNLQET